MHVLIRVTDVAMAGDTTANINGEWEVPGASSTFESLVPFSSSANAMNAAIIDAAVAAAIAEGTTITQQDSKTLFGGVV